MRSFALSRRSLAAVAAGLIAIVGTLSYAEQARAHHEPANKVAAVGVNVESFDKSVVLLEETVKTPGPTDLILSLTAECSIITELTTGGTGADDFSEASGTVDVWVTIDGTRVPLSSVQQDDGTVTLCNRTYGRSVEDSEGDGDIDEQDDYIRTKNANAFNWLALDTGFAYDNPANGNNILDIVVHAAYTTNEEGRALADAYVGSRTLIVEPTNASVHESTGTGE